MLEICDRLQFNINKGHVEQLLDKFDYDHKGRFVDQFILIKNATLLLFLVLQKNKI